MNDEGEGSTMNLGFSGKLGSATFALFVVFALVSTGCGGGGGGALGPGGAAASTGSVLLSGQVHDGPVQGATLEVSLTPDFTSILTRVNDISTVDGSYRFSLDSSVLPNGATVYVRSSEADPGIDTDTGSPAPRLSGVATVVGNAVILTLTPVSSLVVETLSRDRSANVTQAIEVVANLFGLTGSSLALNSVSVTAGSTLEQASEAIIRAAKNVGGLAGGGTVSDTALRNLVSSLATGIASGNADVSSLIQARQELTVARTDALNHIPVIQPSAPTFIATSVFFGNEVMPLNGAITQPAGGFRRVTVDPQAPVNGGQFPNVGINFSGASSFEPGTRFVGELTLSVVSTSDQRQLTLRINPIHVTVNATRNGGLFEVPLGAQLSASGTAGNQVFADLRLNVGQSQNIDLITSQNVGASSRLTFQAHNILERIRARFNLDASTHPVFLLQTAGTFNLVLSYVGLPISTVNGRISEIAATTLVIQ